MQQVMNTLSKKLLGVPNKRYPTSEKYPTNTSHTHKVANMCPFVNSDGRTDVQTRATLCN